jgi:6-phosphogluconolactonase
MLHEHVFSDSAALLPVLLQFCVQALHEDLTAAPEVSCLLSGGNTPRRLYEQLARADLPWQRITPALVDERRVPVTDPASNEGMLRTIFTHNAGFLARLQGMHSAHPDAATAQADCEARYASLPLPWSFGLLGMGNDGHTASLFPGAAGLQQGLSGEHLCQAISAQSSGVTGVHTERLTLTLAGLLRAKRLLLYFTGQDKWQVYQDALHCHDVSTLPVAAVLQQSRTPVHVFYHP